MEKLWAPWRLEYIQGPKTGGCVFCLPEERSEDRDRLVLFRGEYSFVIMNRYPYSNGHLMVAPYRHLGDHAELSVDDVWEMHRLMVLCQEVLRKRFRAEGFNVGWNVGLVAGAGIADHLHLHIVPRWQGDTNFMPVFGDVRVIPQHLESTYRQLQEEFADVDLPT